MQLQTVLETERLRLTNWLPEHADDLQRLHGDAKVARYLDGDGVPWPPEKVKARLERWAREFAEHRMGKLRATRKSDGAFVGRAGFGIYGPTGEPEIGYAMLPENWGKGYALEAARGLRDWIFAETEWDHFIGLADTRNTPSLNILSRLGMQKTHVDVDPGGLTCQFFIMQKQDWHG